MSLAHQTEDLALKSPKMMVNKELHEVVSFKAFSKFDKKIFKFKTVMNWGPIYNQGVREGIFDIINCF